jgi:beta-glucosidase
MIIKGIAVGKLFIVVFFLLTSIFNYAQVYLDPSASVEARVEDLLSQMTLDEKIGQMTQADKTAFSRIEDVAGYYLGSVLSGGGAAPDVNTPSAWADMVDGFQAAALTTRLKIPIIYGVDAVHGHNNVRGAVIFPHNIGLGCTRNPDLVEQAAKVTAAEVAATGIRWNFGPCIAVPRDERWGRTYEGYGETAELAQMFGAAAVKGYQGDTLNNNTSILACAKHFIADGATNGGEDQGDAVINEQELRAIHLPGYVAAIEQGVGSIMASFSSWNGDKVHGSKYLLTDLLKGELGFEGFVISDWQAIDQLPGDYSSDVAVSINAGIDMVMVPYDYALFISTLKSVVQSGLVSQERIDDAVRRILTQKFKLGLFENPFTDRSMISLVGSEEHRAIARQAVRESVVLLKKKDGILPIPKSDVNIFLAGSHANNLGYQCGGWTISWQGSGGNITDGTTILYAMMDAVQSGVVYYNAEGDFDNLEADYSVVVIGETPYAESSGDKADLTISSTDVSLIKKMKALGKPVIVIIISGRPLIINPILHYSDVILAAWLPGTEGQGLTDVLFGDYNPKGVLSNSWSRSMDQIPINIGDINYNPLYAYGYGITTFEDSPAGSSPVYQSSLVQQDGGKIEITFNKSMKDPSALSNTVFNITSNGNIINHAGLTLKEGDATTIFIELQNSISLGDIVSIQYISGSLESTDNGQLQVFGPTEVFNAVRTPAFALPGFIEAENYSDMFGVQTENTTDVGGGLNVGWIDDGDWMEYYINPQYSGIYMLKLRIASQSAAGRIKITSDDNIIGTRSLPVTGDWQSWQTVNQITGFEAGEQILRITAELGGFNLNWLQFDIVTSVNDVNEIPNDYELVQNYPNPFNPSTYIEYSLPEKNNVVIKVYNMLGEEVATLIDQVQNAGKYKVMFNAVSGNRQLPSGMYLYQLSTGNKSYTKKMLLLK